MSITTIIVIASAALSFLAFQNRDLMVKLLFNAYQVVHRKEYYRVITHAFIHANFLHLFFNMYVLYLFGNAVEGIFTNKKIFDYYFPGLEFWGVSRGYLYFILLYLGGILFAVLPSIRKNKDNPSYNSLGASGAVSAVVMAFILLLPTQDLYLFFIPIGIPGFLFGAAYLFYEYYMSKRGGTGIAHDAHFWGAIYGLVLLIILKPGFIVNFFQQIGQLIGL